MSNLVGKVTETFFGSHSNDPEMENKQYQYDKSELEGTKPRTSGSTRIPGSFEQDPALQQQQQQPLTTTTVGDSHYTTSGHRPKQTSVDMTDNPDIPQHVRDTYNQPADYQRAMREQVDPTQLGGNKMGPTDLDKSYSTTQPQQMSDLAHHADARAKDTQLSGAGLTTGIAQEMRQHEQLMGGNLMEVEQQYPSSTDYKPRQKLSSGDRMDQNLSSGGRFDQNLYGGGPTDQNMSPGGRLDQNLSAGTRKDQNLSSGRGMDQNLSSGGRMDQNLSATVGTGQEMRQTNLPAGNLGQSKMEAPLGGAKAQEGQQAGIGVTGNLPAPAKLESQGDHLDTGEGSSAQTKQRRKSSFKEELKHVFGVFKRNKNKSHSDESDKLGAGTAAAAAGGAAVGTEAELAAKQAAATKGGKDLKDASSSSSSSSSDAEKKRQQEIGGGMAAAGATGAAGVDIKSDKLKHQAMQGSGMSPPKSPSYRRGSKQAAPEPTGHNRHSDMSQSLQSNTISNIISRHSGYASPGDRKEQDISEKDGYSKYARYGLDKPKSADHAVESTTPEGTTESTQGGKLSPKSTPVAQRQRTRSMIIDDEEGQQLRERAQQLVKDEKDDDSSQGLSGVQGLKDKAQDIYSSNIKPTLKKTQSDKSDQRSSDMQAPQTTQPGYGYSKSSSNSAAIGAAAGAGLGAISASAASNMEKKEKDRSMEQDQSMPKDDSMSKGYSMGIGQQEKLDRALGTQGLGQNVESPQSQGLNKDQLRRDEQKFTSSLDSSGGNQQFAPQGMPQTQSKQKQDYEHTARERMDREMKDKDMFGPQIASQRIMSRNINERNVDSSMRSASHGTQTSSGLDDDGTQINAAQMKYSTTNADSKEDMENRLQGYDMSIPQNHIPQSTQSEKDSDLKELEKDLRGGMKKDLGRQEKDLSSVSPMEAKSLGDQMSSPSIKSQGMQTEGLSSSLSGMQSEDLSSSKSQGMQSKGLSSGFSGKQSEDMLSSKSRSLQSEGLSSGLSSKQSEDMLSSKSRGLQSEGLPSYGGQQSEDILSSQSYGKRPEDMLSSQSSGKQSGDVPSCGLKSDSQQGMLHSSHSTQTEGMSAGLTGAGLAGAGAAVASSQTSGSQEEGWMDKLSRQGQSLRNHAEQTYHQSIEPQLYGKSGQTSSTGSGQNKGFVQRAEEMYREKIEPNVERMGQLGQKSSSSEQGKSSTTGATGAQGQKSYIQQAEDIYHSKVQPNIEKYRQSHSSSQSDATGEGKPASSSKGWIDQAQEIYHDRIQPNIDRFREEHHSGSGSKPDDNDDQIGGL
ncbi:hypothetical protein TRVA0_036S01200 [Trichomonascus vanleenenianus]|uniref:uncharacterized protein n=1 Tax=Trichomonascus vanleenenianus TaxID=2268995 RepID=UPI003ECB3EF9